MGSSLTDIWEDIPVLKEEYVEFDFDPLAFILAGIENNINLSVLYELLVDKNLLTNYNYNDLYRVIFDNIHLHMIKSQEIQKYFKNKLLLRRVKGYHISEYMMCLETLLSNFNKIKKEHISILLKLPDFYRESTETDQVYKNFFPLKEQKNSIKNVNDRFCFVKKINRFSRKNNFSRYYFSNANNNLALISINKNSNEDSLMEYIVSSNQSITIKGSSKITCQEGYDFLIYTFPNKYQLVQDSDK